MTEADQGPKREVLEAGAKGSPLRAYQDLVVGSRSWGRLIRYELTSWATCVPGAAGVVLRKMLIPGLLSDSGRGTVWGHGIVLRHPGKMRVGQGVVVDDGCYFDAKGCDVGEFEIGDGAFISRGCVVSGKSGALTLGPQVNLGVGCVLYAAPRLEIGAHTMLAANCYIGGGRYDAETPRGRTIAEHPLPGRGVSIGEDCWLGAGVIVVDGVTVGRGCVIGAGAVVTRDLPPFTIAAGVPARPIGERGREHERRSPIGGAK